MDPALPVYAVLALAGLVMGSAVTALSWRIPRDVSWARGRSACPRCGAVLGPADLVPLFSFLFSLGRCRHCRAPIPWRYPLTELACAAWAVLLFREVGLQWAYLPLAVWGFMLVALLWIDLDFQLLPDVLTLPGAALGTAAALLLRGLVPGALHALFGILASGGMLWLLAVAWKRLRKIEGMGEGDIKLAAMFGAVLGWQLGLLTLFVAAFMGSLWGLALIAAKRGDGRTALPFGTLLAPAALVVFLFGRQALDAYTALLRGH